ncbi:alpha-L-rhamnosidase [Shouchella shacheensis]|uniref:alpha-L-rhamnosidase n=1 Tax=Shouchella shacheensis TaxID=1649580 RepID=UPI00073FE89E|nr:alpha-L-rhamnosidase [Shouchella shacheensis]
MLKLTNVLCEYMENPIGLDVDNPRISWQLRSDKRGTNQTAYQVQVATDKNYEEIVADSGKILSDHSVHVQLPPFKVEAKTLYHYRVKVWTGSGACDWSEGHYFETGLLRSDAWSASWVSATENLVEDAQSPRFRRTFDYQSPKLTRARLYITATGLYEARLNGARVGDAYFTPGWTNYHKRLQYQTYDVTELIREGENVLGVTLGKGWYSGNLAWEGKVNIYGNEQSFIAELHVESEDGEHLVVFSDDNWKTGKSPILESELYHGETYDARLEEPGWDEANFQEDGWVVAKANKKPTSHIVAQENEPVRKQGRITPIKLIHTPNGEVVLDFGQNMVGWVHFKIKGDKSKTVSLKHFEVLDANGNVYLDNLRQAKQTITYTLRGGEEETYEPFFSFQGFRYVQLIGFDESVKLGDFTGIVLHSDMRRIGNFECSNPSINQLQHNIVWGQKGNFLDVPTDCPQRDERLGWTGDAQMFISTASYLYNVAPFFKKWLRDLTSEQGLDGSVPFVIPDTLDPDSHSSAAWGDAAVICPWTLYENYGDERLLEEQFPSMKAWVNYIRKQGSDEYLWNTGFHFGDWLALDSQPDTYIGATERDFIATAFYAYSARLVSRAADVLGKESEYVHYNELYQSVKAAFAREFITGSGRLSVPTQTAHILALMFDLVDGDIQKRTERKLKQLLKDAHYHLKTGFVGTPYLNFALSKAGYDQVAYTLLFQKDYPSWLYQVEKGATTVWEHWDGIKEDGSFWSEDMNSFNHYAYGSIGDWLYRRVAGIDLDKEAVGFKRIHFAPRFTKELSWVKGTLHTMYGNVESSWSFTTGSEVVWDVTVPANATGIVHIPSDSTSSVKEGNQALEQAEGIRNVIRTEEGLLAEVGSGDYRFQFPYSAVREKHVIVNGE